LRPSSFSQSTRKPFGERRVRIAVEVAADRLRRRILETELQLPIRDVGRENVIGEFGGDCRELGAVALVVGHLGRQEIGIRLRKSRRRRQRKRGKADCNSAAGTSEGGHGLIVGERGHLFKQEVGKPLLLGHRARPIRSQKQHAPC
jgi:hypothetical protein